MTARSSRASISACRIRHDASRAADLGPSPRRRSRRVPRPRSRPSKRLSRGRDRSGKTDGKRRLAPGVDRGRWRTRSPSRRPCGELVVERGVGLEDARPAGRGLPPKRSTPGGPPSVGATPRSRCLRGRHGASASHLEVRWLDVTHGLGGPERAFDDEIGEAFEASGPAPVVVERAVPRRVVDDPRRVGVGAASSGGHGLASTRVGSMRMPLENLRPITAWARSRVRRAAARSIASGSRPASVSSLKSVRSRAAIAERSRRRSSISARIRSGSGDSNIPEPSRRRSSQASIRPLRSVSMAARYRAIGSSIRVAGGSVIPAPSRSRSSAAEETGSGRPRAPWAWAAGLVAGAIRRNARQVNRRRELPMVDGSDSGFSGGRRLVPL